MVGVFLKFPYEFHIVSDDDHLKIAAFIHLHDLDELVGQAVDVRLVEIGGRFVEGQKPGVGSKNFSQSHPNDEGG